jgi:hypothetical protein
MCGKRSTSSVSRPVCCWCSAPTLAHVLCQLSPTFVTPLSVGNSFSCHIFLFLRDISFSWQPFKFNPFFLHISLYLDRPFPWQFSVLPFHYSPLLYSLNFSTLFIYSLHFSTVGSWLLARFAIAAKKNPIVSGFGIVDSFLADRFLSPKNLFVWKKHFSDKKRWCVSLS